MPMLLIVVAGVLMLFLSGCADTVPMHSVYCAIF